MTITTINRLGQTLNVYWEKTPEKVLYEVVVHTVDSFGDVIVTDFTATEDVNLQDLNESGEYYQHVLNQSSILPVQYPQ